MSFSPHRDRLIRLATVVKEKQQFCSLKQNDVTQIRYHSYAFASTRPSHALIAWIYFFTRKISKQRVMTLQKNHRTNLDSVPELCVVCRHCVELYQAMH